MTRSLTSCTSSCRRPGTRRHSLLTRHGARREGVPGPPELEATRWTGSCSARAERAEGPNGRTPHVEPAAQRLVLQVHLLALVETDPSTKVVDETRATVTSNIGSALHFLGETELAEEFYKKALKEFEATGTGWLTWLYMGNLNAKRVMYIQARLAMLSAGERPDPSGYQDGYGKARQWTKEEMEIRIPTTMA